MPLVRLLGERLLAGGGKAVATRDALAGASAVGLYFSASWCPPCRGFTPQLVASHQKTLEAKGLKCVLISWDREEPAFREYFTQMPRFLALPYEDKPRIAALGEKFGVKTIPTLALVDPQGKTITTEARNAVVQDPEGRDYPWVPPLVRDLAHLEVGRLNELPSVVILTEAADAAQQHEALEELTEVAETFVSAHGPDRAFAYFVASGGPLAKTIRERCRLPAGGPPRLLVIDVQDNLSFYLGPEGEDALKGDSIRALLGGYEKGFLPKSQMT